MQQRTACLTIWIFALVFFSSCREQTSSTVSGTYISHVQLDSTLLIATEVANGLEVPWDISVDPDGWIWFNEQKGRVSRLNPHTSEIVRLLEIIDLYIDRTAGLLSKVLHPQFKQYPFVYLYYVYNEKDDDLNDNIASRIVRYTFDKDTLINRKIILDNLPATNRHNGSRMVITPDMKLWLGNGDAGRSDLAQNPQYYNGKVLRMNLDGSVPEDNPLRNSRVWSTGHRNIQGITFGNGNIYVSEHGAAANDEVNLIQKSGNYGWPDVEGYCETEIEIRYCEDSFIIEPIKAFTPSVAPAGIEYFGHNNIPEWENSLLLVNLAGEALRVLNLNEESKEVNGVRVYFHHFFGRIRDIAVGPDGTIYLATSNMDWRHNPDDPLTPLTVNGDRIIMLQKAHPAIDAYYVNMESKKLLFEEKAFGNNMAAGLSAGAQLYIAQCSNCHGPEGAGISGLGPPLIDNNWVTGDRNRLIQVILNGSSRQDRPDGNIYNWEMPSFRNRSDEDIAAILTYIRNEFANNNDLFTPTDIRQAR